MIDFLVKRVTNQIGPNESGGFVESGQFLLAISPNMVNFEIYGLRWLANLINFHNEIKIYSEK